MFSDMKLNLQVVALRAGKRSFLPNAGFFFTILIIAITAGTQDSIAREPDWTFYSALLKEYTYPGHREFMDATLVNYTALKKDKRWPELIRMLAEFPKTDLETKAEKMAFYINGYNILSINMVISNWPVIRLKSLGSMLRPVWTHHAGVLAGEKVTLRRLEHGILRKMGDPRIHVAVNCASMSCPDLRPEPYTAGNLDAQLDDQAVKFLAQKNKGILIDNNSVYLSSIFDWFEDDFVVVGGVESFVRKYRTDLPKGARFKGVLPYNWNINANLSPKERKKALAAFDW